MNSSDFRRLQLSLTPKPDHWYWDDRKDTEVFLQVFEFPEFTSSEFCFNGGNVVIFRQRNWINTEMPDPGYEKLKIFLQEQLNADNVLQRGKKYLVILSNGDCFIFPPVFPSNE